MSWNSNWFFCWGSISSRTSYKDLFVHEKRKETKTSSQPLQWETNHKQTTEILIKLGKPFYSPHISKRSNKTDKTIHPMGFKESPEWKRKIAFNSSLQKRKRKRGGWERYFSDNKSFHSFFIMALKSEK